MRKEEYENAGRGVKLKTKGPDFKPISGKKFYD